MQEISFVNNFSRAKFFVFWGTHLVDTFLNNMPVKQIWRKSAVCSSANNQCYQIWRSDFLSCCTKTLSVIDFMPFNYHTDHTVFWPFFWKIRQNVASHFTWKAFYHAWREKPFHGSPGVTWHMTSYVLTNFSKLLVNQNKKYVKESYYK